MKKVQKKIGRLEQIPFFFVLIIIPIIVLAKKYDTGLTEYAWHSDHETVYDFYLLYKSRVLIIIGMVSLWILSWRLYEEKQKKREQFIFPETFWIPLGLYGILTLFSALFSANIEFSFWGSSNQFEGAFVLLTYCILACYGLYFISKYDIEEKLIQWLVYGASIVSVIGAIQFMGFDFFRTSFGKSLITILDTELSSSDVTFSFDVGRTLSTLYNPNYVGTYIALLLPLVVVSFVISQEKWRKILAAICSCMMILSLIGSESMTGYIAIFISAILFLVMMLPWIKMHKKKCGCIFIGIIAIMAFVVLVKKDAFQYGFNKVFNSTHKEYLVSSITTKPNEGIQIHTSSQKTLCIRLEAEQNQGNFYLTDQDGNAINSDYDEGSNRLIITDAPFEGVSLVVGNLTVNSSTCVAFNVTVESHTWTFVIVDGNYMFYSPYEKVSEIRDIDSIGFEYSQHFASRRGFIWSRTLPLVKEHILLGSGPDTFLLEFPNDDFVGMENNNYFGEMVTKPHNMYLQIAVQTGVLSLISFLTLYLIYFLSSIKLYWRKDYDTLTCIGLGCLLGTFGYMITGLANDSSVTVAPLFWLLFGIGTGINYKIKRLKEE